MITYNTQTSIGTDSWSVANGGGFYAWADSVSLVRCQFVGNAALGINDDASNLARGGGAAILATYTILEDCSFVDNESEARSLATVGGSGRALGGGLFCQSATLRNCRFEGNLATSLGGRFGNEAAGGGIYGDDVVLMGCVFSRNGVLAGPPNPYEAFGGGIAVTGGSAVYWDTFSENWATTRASGLGFRGSGTAQIDKTIVAFGGFSEAVSCTGTSLMLSCTDVFGNAGGDWVGCIASQSGVNGNLSSDPLFCDLPGSNLGLAANSPCAPPNSPGQCGLIGALPVACGAIGIADAGVSSALGYLRVHPNPVDGQSLLEWSTSGGGTQEVKIYDISGRLILRRGLPVHGAGRHEVAWSDVTQGRSLPNGVYFLMVGSEKDTRPIRIVIMK